MVGQTQAEEAIVPTAANEVEQSSGKEKGGELDGGEQPQNSVFQMKNLLWHGGSVWDAWFSCASNQVKFSLTSPEYSSEFPRETTKSLSLTGFFRIFTGRSSAFDSALLIFTARNALRHHFPDFLWADRKLDGVFDQCSVC